MSIFVFKNWTNCEILKFLLVGLLMSLINIGGIILNITAIVVFVLKKEKTRTVFILIGLEIIDILFLISLFLNISLVNLTRYSLKIDSQKSSPLDRPDYINVTQKFVSVILMGSMMAGSWHVMILAIERYIAICHPHYSLEITRKRLLIFQAIICIFSYSINSVHGLENEAKFIKDKQTWTIHTTNLKRNKIFSIYLLIQYLLLQFLIPVSVILLFSFLLIKVVQIRYCQIYLNI